MAVISIKDRTRNRAARERALISAARKLFASRGFEPTTTREIAAEAGCAEGLIHRYFNGKAGLLLAIIRERVSQEVSDLSDKRWLAATLEDEIVQLIEWEVDRMWEDREFLKVVVPRALLDPAFGQVITHLVAAERGLAIADRLKRLKECQSLGEEEIDALANSVGVIGFMFGFMRPVVLRQDRDHAKRMAATIGRMIGHSCSASVASTVSYSSVSSIR